MNNNNTQCRAFRNHIWDDYRYDIHSHTATATYYVCINYKNGTCPGRGVKKNDEFEVTTAHNHRPNRGELKERLFKQNLYVNVSTRDGNYRQIYDEVRLSHPEGARNWPFARCENTMYKWRQKNSPQPVNCFSDYVNVINSNEWKHLKDYDTGSLNVSLATTNDLSKSIVIVDPEFVQHLGINGFVFLDGTFKSVPCLINGLQLITLITIRYNHAIPFAWILMERKTTQAYVAAFEKLRNLLPGFRISEAMIDFEAALRNALRLVFPGVIIYGCHFHYCQALYRKAIKLGFKVFLRQNNEAKFLLRQLMALAFLPSNEIIATFHEIVDSLPPRIRQKMKEFLKYYKKEWLQKVTPDLFCVYQLIRRTNNVLESYNRTLQQKIGIHPQIWKFTRNLVHLQQSLRYDFVSLQRGHRVSRVKKVHDRKKEELLRIAWDKLSKENRPTSFEFLNEVIAICINPVLEYFNTFHV
ncbi:uncharacterized protein LOC122510421 [Leptopilina heterotoma]|uniref:uncharacterized protein LOC122510421 n=1 Tax=Leptopilina heterotoma TaxID=63436 RepID=UPI001CA7BBCF|nr:uncharacterized protein LOC122510421 [Leptopilina heterotoma]